MQRKPSSFIVRGFLIRTVSLCAIFFGLLQVSEAGTTRFAASYQLSNVVEQGNEVHVKLTINLFNPGNGEVKGGIVAVLDSTANPTLIGAFSPIKSLDPLHSVTVNKTFTIPAAEYARWQQGHDPLLQFLVPNADGATTESVQSHRLQGPVEAGN